MTAPSPAEQAELDRWLPVLRILGGTPDSRPKPRPISDEEQAFIDRQESLAEDLAWERRHGRVSESEIERREQAYEAHLDRMWGAA